jgi:hypothetical protein
MPESVFIGAMDLFMCRGCGASYAVIRRPQRRQDPPPPTPKCEECERAMAISESGCWLTYERADPIILSELDR